MPVWRVEIEVPEGSGLQVEGLLDDHGISSFEIQDHATLGASSPVAEGQLRFVSYTDPDRGPSLVSAGQRAFPEARVSGGPFEDQAWTEVWKQFIPTVVISDRAVVRPPFHASPRPELPEVVIDPGLAFGTGGHETTQLVTELALKWSAELSEPLEVADIGCGTCVVSAVLTRLLDVQVDACDIDPEAVRVANEVCEANGVLDSINITVGSASDLKRTYPMVIANILAEILVSIAPEIAQCCGKDTILIVSGVLADESDAFLERFNKHIQAEVLEEKTKGIWTAYVLHCTI
jgi:ribosomal protein L11 methyltransferase